VDLQWVLGLRYWLLKTEPDEYSYSDLERDGKTRWNGVTKNLALKNLRSIRKGDLALIYHTGNEKQAVGIAEVTTDPYPDPT
jgi:predicted RNA-binding protein with PUA-like domain